MIVTFVVLYFFPGNDDILNPENDTIGILVSTAVDITVGSRNIKPAGIKLPDKITNKVQTNDAACVRKQSQDRMWDLLWIKNFILSERWSDFCLVLSRHQLCLNT